MILGRWSLLLTVAAFALVGGACGGGGAGTSGAAGTTGTATASRSTRISAPAEPAGRRFRRDSARAILANELRRSSQAGTA